MKKLMIAILVIILVGGGVWCFYNKDTFQNETTDGEKNSINDDDKKQDGESVVDKILDAMTLDEKIGQLFIVNLDELENGSIKGYFPTIINDKQINNLKKYNVGGVIFFTNNLTNKDTLIDYINDLQNNSKYPLFISVDEEGGIVSRLGRSGNFGVTYFPNMRSIGDSDDESKAFHVGDTLGRELRTLGFNLDFAPVADINTNLNNPVIGNRSFGTTKEVVSKMVVQEILGLQTQKVSATLKHFPGHGDTSTDSHTGLPIVNSDKDRLNSIELVPFKAGIEAGTDFVLTAHIALPNVTGNNMPATMSKDIVTNILREQLEFKNVIITDALDMGAITNNYTMEETVLNCINAGIDIMLMPKDLDVAFHTVQTAIKNGTITEERINESVRRILEIKIKREIIK